MSQIHPYDVELAYHFANLSLTGEVQPIWEADDPKNPDLENIFAIPRQYYDELFIASGQLTGDTMYADIQGFVNDYYEQIGAIRVGMNIIPDYEELDMNWTLSEIDSLETMFSMVSSYSQRVTETFANTVRYSFSNLLMGYALRSKVDGHGVIVMRGTVSTDEWLNNINYRLVPFHPLDDRYGNVHNGFRDVYKGLRGQYRQLVDEFEADKDIYLIGHSLGASVSQIAALDIAIKNPERADKIHVYGYAPPRVGDQTFANVYNTLVGTSYRIVNICDVVPFVPFAELGVMMNQASYDYADTKGEIAFIHQAGNPIANHVGSYHLATLHRIPGEMDASYPTVLT